MICQVCANDFEDHLEDQAWFICTECCSMLEEKHNKEHGVE